MPNSEGNTERNLNEQRAAIDTALRTLVEPESSPRGGLPSTANVGANQLTQQAGEAVNLTGRNGEKNG